MANPSFTQVAYRLRNDDGSETTATWKQNQNVSSVAQAEDTNFRVRFLIDETAARSWTSKVWQLYYSLNGGAYAAVTGSTPVKFSLSSNFADGDDCTSQLTGGSGSFLTDNNGMKETTGGATNTGAAGNFFELEFCLQIDSAQTVNEDSIQLRIYDSASAIAAYTNTPLIYVNVTPPPPGLFQCHFRIRTDDSQTLNADAGWKAALDTNATMDAGKPFRIRFEVEGRGSNAATGFKLQYKKGAGSWANTIQTGSIATPGVLIIQSDQFADADATTNILSGSTKTFEAGQGKETPTTASQTLIDEHTEHEWGLMLMGLYDNRALNVTNDTYQFRIVKADGSELDGYEQTPTITVNMPAGYIGGTAPETMGRTLHVDSNKNLYYITEPAESGGLFTLIKSSDGGDSWTVMDSAGSPTETDLESVDASYDSSLHCLHIIHKGSGTGNVMYHRYNTSDHPTTPDQFAIIDEVVAASIGQTDQSCAIQHRSDGTVVGFYRKTNGAAENMMYKIRSSGGTWGSELTIDAEASQVFGHICVVKGASDKIHIFYNNWTAGIGYHRSLSSADSLSARESIGSTLGTGSSSEKNMGQPVYWDSSGNEKIMVIFRNDSTGRINSVVVTNDGTPETAKVVSDATVEISEAGSKQPLASLGQDGLDTYCLMVYTSDFDLYRDKSINDGGWGTDVSQLANVEIDFIQSLVFTHSSGNGGAKVLGYFVEDSTTLVDGFTGGGWYKEYEIAAGGANLTANNITSGVPVLDPPTIGQTHVLNSADITSGVPVLDAPTIGQTYALNSTDILSGIPVLDAPTAGTIHNLTSTDVTSGIPVLDAPTIAQTHVLGSVDILSGVPVLDAPTIAQTHVLGSVDILSGVPVLDAPAIGETHALSSIDITSGVPVLDPPTIAQTHALSSIDVTSGVPVLDAPTIAQTHVLSSADILSGIPVLETSAIGQTHILSSADITSGIPVLDAPTISQTLPDELTATDITSGIPVLESPTIGQIHVLGSTDVLSGIPILGTPTIGQTHVLGSVDILSGIPVLGTPTIGQTLPDELTATDITSGIPTLEAPTIGQTHVLGSTDILSGIPVLDAPSINQTHILISEDIISGIPILGAPTLSEVLPDELVATDILSGVPVLTAPTIGQNHLLISNNIEAENPELESPIFSQVHSLVGVNITTSPAILGSPVFGQVHILIGEDLISEAPILGAPIFRSSITPTLYSRMYIIYFENRIRVVEYENRVLDIDE